MIQERRQHQRLVPDSPPSVYLGGSKRGPLLDLSEAGVGVECLLRESQGQAFSLEFDLPGGGGPIQARVEIAWSSNAGQRTGLRFLDLADTSRQQLRDWISARAYDSALVPAEETSQPLGQGAPVNLVSQQEGDKRMAEWEGVLATLRGTHRESRLGLSRLGHLRRTVGLALAVVIFVPVFIFVGHLLGNRTYNLRAKETTAVPNSPGSGPKRAVATPELPPAPSRPATLSLDVPGFVVQVAAMTHENNADALRESLEAKDFPAFVFRRNTGRFYRVVVGPYADPDTAGRVKDKLEEQGFEAIVKAWSPE
jgi:SPOR domain/PilZ domain